MHRFGQFLSGIVAIIGRGSRREDAGLGAVARRVVAVAPILHLLAAAIVDLGVGEPVHGIVAVVTSVGGAVTYQIEHKSELDNFSSANNDGNQNDPSRKLGKIKHDTSL